MDAGGSPFTKTASSSALTSLNSTERTDKIQSPKEKPLEDLSILSHPALLEQAEDFRKKYKRLTGELSRIRDERNFLRERYTAHKAEKAQWEHEKAMWIQRAKEWNDKEEERNQKDLDIVPFEMEILMLKEQNGKLETQLQDKQSIEDVLENKIRKLEKHIDEILKCDPATDERKLPQIFYQKITELNEKVSYYEMQHSLLLQQIDDYQFEIRELDRARKGNATILEPKERRSLDFTPMPGTSKPEINETSRDTPPDNRITNKITKPSSNSNGHRMSTSAFDNTQQPKPINKINGNKRSLPPPQNGPAMKKVGGRPRNWNQNRDTLSQSTQDLRSHRGEENPRFDYMEQRHVSIPSLANYHEYDTTTVGYHTSQTFNHQSSSQQAYPPGDVNRSGNLVRFDQQKYCQPSWRDTGARGYLLDSTDKPFNQHHRPTQQKPHGSGYHLPYQGNFF